MSEKDRLWKLLLLRIKGLLKTIEIWKFLENIEEDKKKEIIHDLEMELSGVLSYATFGSFFPIGYNREEIIKFAKEYNPE